MKLSVLKNSYTICRLTPQEAVPREIYSSPFYSITKTDNELSIVAEEQFMAGVVDKIEKDWKVFKVEGTLDFSLTGVLNSLTKPLAEAEISIFAISTFDTDYLMVKNAKFDLAVKVLEKSGFEITRL